MEQLVGVGVAWKLGGQIGVQVIRLVTVAILARLLTPADYGAAAIAIALATFAPTVGDMGMGSALVQTNAGTRLVRSTAFWASLGFGIALSVLLAVAAGPVGQFLDDPRVGAMVAVGGLTFFDLFARVGESGRVHAGDEVPEHRASLLVRAHRRQRSCGARGRRRCGPMGPRASADRPADHLRRRALVARGVAPEA